MPLINFDEVKLWDDELSDMDIMKAIIKEQDQEDAFYILNVADVIEKHKEWIRKMPRIIPHYAIKCNPDPTVIKVLAALNASFDCASEREIRQVMQYGVSGERIIFANPAKTPSHIKFAKKVGVDRMTADSEVELFKIKEFYPEARVVLRILCDSQNTPISLGLKFGCDPQDEVIRLIQLTKDLGLTLHGFSFHVGSPCGELYTYGRGIRLCSQLITIAKSMGCADVQLIDIGGGFPGETGTNVDMLASIVNDAVKDLDPSINVISEPGRYYVTSAFTLAAYLHTKKIIHKNDQVIRMYYMNCGAYTSFIEELLVLKQREPFSLFSQQNGEKYPSKMWGPTCDSYDCILQNALLPEFHVGDWLVWKEMGAYTLSLCTSFNGMLTPTVYPIMRKNEWKALCADVNINEKCNGDIELVTRSDAEYIESR